MVGYKALNTDRKTCKTSEIRATGITKKSHSRFLRSESQKDGNFLLGGHIE